MKTYPFVAPDVQAYLNAINHRGQMSPAQMGGVGAALIPGGAGGGTVRAFAGGRTNISTAVNRRWDTLGPFNFAPPSDPLTQNIFGPSTSHLAGRVNGMASDSQGNVYVATAGGGLWRFDMNPTFVPFDSFNPRLRVDPYNPTNPSPRQLSDSSFAALQTTSVAIDPRNDKVIYVGLGDYNLAGSDVLPGEGSFAARQSNNVGYSLGMMKSVNGGKTWANIGNSGLNKPPTYQLAAGATTTVFTPQQDPANPNDPVMFLSNRKNEYNGLSVFFQTGPNAGVSRVISAYSGPPHQFTLATALPQTPTANDQFIIVGFHGMEGTAVSSIIVDPDNSKHIVATAGRGINPGSIWYSDDAGNSFTRATLRNLDANGAVQEIAMPDGDYSNVDFSLPDRQGRRVFYAARVGDGIYRSFDHGRTWSKMGGVPLVFNTAGGGVVGLKVAFSRKGATPGTVYVFDASGAFNDGRILKSLDAFTGIDSGDPLSLSLPQWTDVTGDFPRNEGTGNNFQFANYYTTFSAGQIVVNIEQVDSLDPNNLIPIGTKTQEAVVGGQKWEAVGLGAVDTGSGLFGSTATGDVIPRDDLGVGQDWNEFAQGQTHWYQHGFTFDNISPFLMFSTNDGGIYQVSEDPGFLVLPPVGSPAGTPPVFFNNGTLNYDVLDPSVDPNIDFRISEFYRADFFETDPGSSPSKNKISVAGSMASNALALGFLDFTVPLNTADPSQNYQWSPLNFNRGGALLNDSDGLLAGNERFDTNGNSLNDTDGIVGFGFTAGNPWLMFDFEIDNIKFDPNDPTGKTQYMITAGNPGTPWGDPNLTGNSFKRVFMTTDGWNTYLDITPDRYLSFVDGNGNDIRLFNQKRNPLIYMYNVQEPADTATGPNWTGEPRPFIGMPIAFGYSERVHSANFGPGDPAGYQYIPNNATTNIPPFNAQGTDEGFGSADQPCMYTGGQFLWRFDPPGSLAKAAFPPGPLGKTADPAAPDLPYTYPQRVFPNQDLGVWRRVSPALATGTNFITAIALVPGNGVNAERIYVGTSAGDVWISQNATTLDRTSVTQDFVVTSAATWRQIAGAGVAGNTLPNRPVTSLSINTDAGATQLGDLIVGLGGAPGVAHVWRATNTTGAAAPIFTPASGQGFASLPDAPVNDIVRNPDDATNTLYAATDLGVFTSIDGGATWSNATAPLGLPNVECTSIKVVPNTPGTGAARQLYVSTFGRGVFRFDLNNVQTSNAPPNLKISQNFTRNGDQIIVNVIITNDPKPPAGQTSVGTAFNVRLTSATIKAGAKVTPSSSLPDNGILIGTIAPGQSEIVTVRFPSSAGRPGQAVFFNAGGTLTLPPFPPGTAATFDNKPGFRTRLP